MKDLNINSVTLNMTKNLESSLEHIGTGDHFVNITPTIDYGDILFIFNKQSFPKIREQDQATRGQAVVAHTINPRIWETEADGSLCFQGHHGLQNVKAETYPVGGSSHF